MDLLVANFRSNKNPLDFQPQIMHGAKYPFNADSSKNTWVVIGKKKNNESP